MSKKTKTIALKSNRTVVAAKILRATATPTPDQIAVRAYEIYLDEGSPDGRHLEHWARAEAELSSGV